ncbi:MAG: cob(I)yrinic acid a,c-diamide adenosyltransferase [Planctomycetes bacterium]|nr:cob(I)yrinic acid a,c-diamide adenosyltransferase [Planctomycetota bacterium]
MKIYTRTGDDGTTGLIGGSRAAKHDPRVAAYGTADELNAAIGVALCFLIDRQLPDAVKVWLGSNRSQTRTLDLEQALARVQEELFVLGALLAAQDEAATVKLPKLSDAMVSAMEKEIDNWETELSPLKNFIMPGGSPAGAALHLARTICRRAERELSALRAADGQPRFDLPVRYLNRLSDWLFVAARVCNKRAGVAETPWIPGK